MRLVIYETTHHETISSILELGVIYFDEITVFISNTEIISSENFLLSPSSKNIKFIFRQPDENNRMFIRKMFRYIKLNKSTHLHISTFDNNRLYFMFYLLFLLNIKVSMSIQAVNEFCSLQFFDVKSLTESIAKLLSHRRIKHYRVFSNKMQEVLSEKLATSAISFIPSSFYKAEVLQNQFNHYFTIAIPGSIDTNRRNYKDVFAALQYLNENYKGTRKLKFVFVGTALNQDGFAIKKQLDCFSSENIKVITFSNYLSQPDYDKQLDNADILWSPLQLNTVYRNVAEEYGITTATGLTGDMMLHPKPTFLPFPFEVPAHYENAIFLYKDVDDFIQQLQELIYNNEVMKRKLEKINDDFKFFRSSNFIKEFEKIVIQKL